MINMRFLLFMVVVAMAVSVPLALWVGGPPAR